MLVWINRPLDGGKTQAAHEIHRRLPGSVICDVRPPASFPPTQPQLCNNRPSPTWKEVTE